jgi:hypothetical protein
MLYLKRLERAATKDCGPVPFDPKKRKQDYLSSLYSEFGCYLENRWLHEFLCVDFDARVWKLLVASYLGKNWIRVF